MRWAVKAAHPGTMKTTATAEAMHSAAAQIHTRHAPAEGSTSLGNLRGNHGRGEQKSYRDTKEFHCGFPSSRKRSFCALGAGVNSNALA